MELMRGNDYLEYVKEIMMKGSIGSVGEGNFIGSIPAYGYDKVKIGKAYTLTPNCEADTVKLIFELFVTEGLGTTTIAHRMNNLGIKPRRSPYRTNPAICDMLRNPVYIGKIRRNRRKTVKNMITVNSSYPAHALNRKIIYLSTASMKPLFPKNYFRQLRKNSGILLALKVNRTGMN